MTRHLVAAAQWAGLALDTGQLQQLTRYGEWLREEATAAGGIGPAEATRIDRRHLADSLCFAQPWSIATPERVLDVGSGVGLPGIPLAIALPDISFTLVDRSGRRCGLMRRAIRVLGLENAEVVHQDIDRLGGTWPVVVGRAALGPSELDRLLRVLESPGMIVLGGSHRSRPDRPAFETVEIPSEILDSPAWILKMAQP